LALTFCPLPFFALAPFKNFFRVFLACFPVFPFEDFIWFFLAFFPLPFRFFCNNLYFLPLFPFADFLALFASFPFLEFFLPLPFFPDFFNCLLRFLFFFADLVSRRTFCASKIFLASSLGLLTSEPEFSGKPIETTKTPASSTRSESFAILKLKLSSYLF